MCLPFRTYIINSWCLTLISRHVAKFFILRFRSSSHARTIAYLEFEPSTNVFSIWTDNTMTTFFAILQNWAKISWPCMYLYKEQSENRSEWDSVLVHDSLHCVAIVAYYTKIVDFQWVPYYRFKRCPPSPNSHSMNMQFT